MAHDGSEGCDQEKATWSNYETVFTNSKAGMECVDKEKVKRVVYEMSKDSAHFRNEQRKQVAVDERIRRLKDQAAKMCRTEMEAYERSAGEAITELEMTRDLSRTWMHVDMDAFYAAVEELDDPSLKTKPMAVGGKSMISTANYVARKYGVRSAMPGFIALKLCPQLVFVKPDFNKYRKMSEATREVFATYDPEFDSGSLDEAHLDVTQYCKEQGLTGGEAAEKLRDEVFSRTGLTCSVGVAPNRMLAKVSSDINKPNGQHVVAASHSSVTDFIRTLPVRKVPGIGKVSAQVLAAFDIQSCGDLFDKRALVSALFSPSSRRFFLEVSMGLGSTQHWETPGDGDVGRKGISCERTFQAISSHTDLEQKATELAKTLSEEMIRKGLKGKTVTLKLKLTTFEVRTRAITLPHYVSSSDEILKPMLKLLSAELPMELRLMGVRVSNFWEEKREPGQASLMQFMKKENAGDQPSAVAGAKDVVDHKMDDKPALVLQQRSLQEYHAIVPEGSSGAPSKPSKSDQCPESDLKVAASGPSSSGNAVAHDQSVLVGMSKCGVCGEMVHDEKQQEHQDFHMALELDEREKKIHREITQGPKWRPRPKQGQRPAKRRKSSVGSLDMYLVKRSDR